jgi:REP element-mobilizing transposase RayT
MSRSYKITNPEGIYFLTFATVGWVDVFTGKEYKDILVDSLKHCQLEKGLVIHSWCIMSNHVHLAASAKNGDLSDIVRDFKKYTSKQLLKAIAAHPAESRREWMLGIFQTAGKSNSNNTHFQFWRQDNQPKEMETNGFMEQKIDYIHNNPLAAGIVSQAEEYLYSSARDYSGVPGIIVVEPIW